jgi:hypothetical protein
MIIDYVIEYKTVCKWGVDRGEVGGFDSSEVKSSIDEVEKFIAGYISRATYRGMSFKDRESLSNETPILLWHRIYKRVELFDLSNWIPRMRCISPPTMLPLYYRVEGQSKKFRPRPFLGDRDEGFYGGRFDSLKSAWSMLKNKNNKIAKIYAYYEWR